jgi:hypothetical protein
MAVHSRPFGHPARLYRAAASAVDCGQRPVAVTFLARVSTDHQQDPTLSLPRQRVNCEAVLPDGWRIVACSGISSPAG